jgi:transcriptional regulator with XRE-family HTH domain
MPHRFDGREVLRRRTALGIRRTPFAADIGRSSEAVAGYEAGTNFPPVPVIERMAERLGCEPGDLFVEVEDTAEAASA